MEENHLHCRLEVEGSDSTRKVALITGITGETLQKKKFKLTLNTPKYQVRMARTWPSSSWTRATQCTASSGEAPPSTLGGSHICTMTQGKLLIILVTTFML